MVFRAPTKVYALILAIVSGTLFATERYVGGAITAVLAIVLLALANVADERGDDDRHTIL